MDGFEASPRKFLLFRLLRRHLHRQEAVIDTTGKLRLVGYGYTGSSNSQNKAIQEITFGFNQTMWADPRYGASI